MKMYHGSIIDRVWEVTDNDFVILDPANPTDNERANKQCNTMALNTIVTPNFKEEIECINLCAPRDQSHT